MILPLTVKVFFNLLLMIFLLTSGYQFNTAFKTGSDPAFFTGFGTLILGFISLVILFNTAGTV